MIFNRMNILARPFLVVARVGFNSFFQGEIICPCS